MELNVGKLSEIISSKMFFELLHLFSVFVHGFNLKM